MNVYPYVDKTRANADGSYPVYIIVSGNGSRFFVNTGMTSCDRLEGRMFPKSEPSSRQKSTILGHYIAEVERLCLRHELTGDKASLKALIKSEVFGVAKKSSSTLASFIARFAATKHPSTATLYHITERKVKSFDAGAMLGSIDAAWLERYRQYCLNEGMRVNGAGKELRNIRAVFNWCRRNGYTTNYPFDGYSIVEEETLPNNLSKDELRRLRDYPCDDWQRKYVDFFMLSFYLAGINPVDLLSLRKDAIRDGHVTFIRKKTDKEGSKKIRYVVLPLVDEAKAIISRYRGDGDNLLSFMDGRKDHHSFVKKCNEALKKIGSKEMAPDKVGRLRKVVYHPLFPSLTLYAARYTFGSLAANELDISEQTIGQCLGHSWSKHVTARYIAHDQRKVDAAVRRVVEFVSGEG